MSTLLLMILLSIGSYADLQEGTNALQSENYDGRSFFFLGSLFRRWRDRWMAFHNPAPLYAGATFPINGYFNCPSYGCNPGAILPQPGYYPAFYSQPQQQHQQQQQQAQGNSNVFIYQADQNSGSSAGLPPYGSGYFRPLGQQMPLIPPSVPPMLPITPLPPPRPLSGSPILPPGSVPSSAQASANSFGYVGGPVPVTISGCGPSSLLCALG